jgi:AraC-like DNA-binding protein
MLEPSISAGFARALVKLAVEKGASREELLRRAGIAEQDLADQDQRLPLHRYVALMREAKTLTGDAALALHFGEAFDIAELSIVGLMGQATATFADAFEKIGRYARLAIDVELQEEAKGERYILSREADGLWVVDMRKNPNASPEVTESGFARMAGVSHRLGLGRSLLSEVHFTHDAPPYLEEYERIFGVPLVFGSDRNAVRLADDNWMELEGPTPSPYVAGVLAERAEALLLELDAAASTRVRLDAWLASVLHAGEARMESAARKLGVSRSTLFRRLKAEGTSFEQVLDGLRYRLALEYIGKRKLRVGEAGYLLGFSDPAAFSRAFKRWTGKSPRAMRG